MRKATLHQYLQIGNMIKSGAIDRTLAQAIIEGGVVMRSEITSAAVSESNGEPEGAHPYRSAPSKNGGAKNEAIEYFMPLYDTDVPEQHLATLAKYRKLATEHGVPTATAVYYRVRAGFTLKTHAPKAGPCYKNYEYLQDWNFPDETTEDGLVFWVPSMVKGNASKTANEQMKLLTNLRAKLELPAHHMSGFGKVGLVAGLILVHFKATGERIPLNEYWVRTDTCGAGGGCLDLGRFDGTGLDCGYWNYDDDADDDVGVFALGVEVLGSSDTRP